MGMDTTDSVPFFPDAYGAFLPDVAGRSSRGLWDAPPVCTGATLPDTPGWVAGVDGKEKGRNRLWRFRPFLCTGREARTPDTRFWRPMLYQLSYSRVCGCKGSVKF